MYIRKQPSGSTRDLAEQRTRGRGEYEISSKFEAATPITPSQLVDKELQFRFGRYGFKRTGNVLRSKHGKKRVQLSDVRAYIHGARQIQAALLFPKSRRDEHGLIGGQPTIMTERYIVRRMHFKELSLAPNSARIALGNVDVYNGSQEDAVDFDERMRQVELLHDNVEQFPAQIRDLLIEHRRLLESTEPVPARAEEIVKALMTGVGEIAPDYNVDYIPGMDVVEPLREILDAPQYEEPIAIESIPEEDIEIRRREAALWRRWAATRGPTAAAFRHEVRNAYRATCVVCGIRLPHSRSCRVPGVDSVHILPWATQGANLICNGLCLCKMHHWTFDQQLIAIVTDQGKYAVEVTDLARHVLSSEALAELNSARGEIPVARLPQNVGEWPRPQFLVELYRLVGA